MRAQQERRLPLPPAPAGFGGPGATGPSRGRWSRSHPAADPVPRRRRSAGARQPGAGDVDSTPASSSSSAAAAAAVTPGPTDVVYLLELAVTVPGRRRAQRLLRRAGGRSAAGRYIGKILQRDNPEDENAVVWLDYTPRCVPRLGRQPDDRAHRDRRPPPDRRRRRRPPAARRHQRQLEGMDADPDVITQEGHRPGAARRDRRHRDRRPARRRRHARRGHQLRRATAC